MRAMQIRSDASPATSVDPTRVTQEKLNRIDAKTTTSLKALSKEIADLKACAQRCTTERSNRQCISRW